MQLSSLLPANYVNERFSDTESIVTLFMLWLQTSVAEVEAQFSLWQNSEDNISRFEIERVHIS